MDQPLPEAYETRSGKVVAVIAACSLVSTVVVGLRFYVRFVIIRKPGADDWALAAALVVTLGAATLMAVATKFGLGHHASLLSLPQFAKVLKLIWIASLTYSSAITLMKATVLLQYRRVFPLPDFQRWCDGFLAFVFVWALSGAVGTFVICLPIERNWDPLTPATCGKRFYFWEAFAITHVITDVFILILPLPLLKNLPLPTTQKGILIAVFCLGFFTCVISSIRITTLRASTMSSDVTWTTPMTVLWSMGEVTCAIVCVCVPTLRPLVTRSYRLWSRPHERNERRDAGGSGRRLKMQPLSDSTGLETQLAPVSVSVGDDRITDASLDRAIQRPPEPQSSTIV